MAESAICLDAMGVLFAAPDDVGELLMPFLRQRGCDRDEAAIRGYYRRCSLGEFTSAELWRRFGVEGNSAELDDTYLARHRTIAGVVELAARLAARGTQVACVSNDIREWNRWRRVRHGLDRDISPWIVSADVGARKPDHRIYQALLRVTETTAQRWTFVDDREPNLDAARELGFRTVRFGGPSTAHAFARDAGELAALLEGAGR